MVRRQDERYPWNTRVIWNLFARPIPQSRTQSGLLQNLSRTGCLFLTTQWIEERRWLRILIEDPNSQPTSYLTIGRVIRRTEFSSIQDSGQDPGSTLLPYGYGIQFTLSQNHLILALSKRNLRVRSCVNLNSKSSLLPGFLA
jgi:hypothetical protein